MSLESVDSLIAKGNQAYIDEEYMKAEEFFTQGLELEPSSILYSNRAAVYLYLEKYQDAIKDCDSALKLNSKNWKALQRKGIAYFRESDYENAKKIFEEGKKSFSDQKLFKTWTLKCEAELDLIKQKNVKKETPKETKKETTKEIPKETVKEAVKESPKITVKEIAQETKKETPKVTQNETQKETSKENVKEIPKESVKEIPKETVKETPKEIPKEVNEQSKPTKPTIKHEWFQSDTFMVISVFIKNLKKEDVKVEITEKTLSVTIKLPTGSDYSLEFDLANDVIPSESKTNILSTKVEIKLKKQIMGLKWVSLESEKTAEDDFRPSYPSSSKKTRNWDQLEKEAVKEQETEENAGDAALNALFKQIYSNGTDEQRKAMIKSFTESGGTKLSTSWEDVGKEKQEVIPPQGMEAKKYEY